MGCVVGKMLKEMLNFLLLPFTKHSSGHQPEQQQLRKHSLEQIWEGNEGVEFVVGSTVFRS